MPQFYSSDERHHTMLLLYFTTAFLAIPVKASFSLKTAADRKSTAHTLAANLLSYNPSSTTGLLPPPYYPWESAGMWSTLLTYYSITGDSTYNAQIASAIATQAGDFRNPQTNPGNDDQLWWGLAAMSAAEVKLPLSGTETWEKLATNIFNEVVARWDNTTCGGGIPWQIDPASGGHSYKNAITNGLAFQLAARLASFTSEDTQKEKYVAWAKKIFSWMVEVKLIDEDTHVVYDGTSSTNNCSDLNHDLWSYNVAVPMYGAAKMMKLDPDAAKEWKGHIEGFIDAAQSSFVKDNVLMEKCEAEGKCNADQLSFKAYLARWLGKVAVDAPEMKEKILPMLKGSGEGALASCNDGGGCGMKWTIADSDGVLGVGQQMSALEITLAISAVQEGVKDQVPPAVGGSMNGPGGNMTLSQQNSSAAGRRGRYR